jgi:dephospho-CoA kinase
MVRSIGITGRMGAGKTWFAEKVWLEMLRRGREANLLILDNIRYRALTSCDSHIEMQLRRNISVRFGLDLDPDGTFPCYRTLMAAILANFSAQQTFSEIVTPHLLTVVAEEIALSEKPVILEWVRLMEEGYAQLLDGPVVHVTCTDAELSVRDKSCRLFFTQADRDARRALQPCDAERIATARALGIDVIQVDTGDVAGIDSVIFSVADILCSN